MKKYRVIGIMSGTSLDGLDIAYCEFMRHANRWTYKIVRAETKKYNNQWKVKLSNAFKSDKRDREQLSNQFGKFTGNEVLKFIKKYRIQADFVASHGHTIFHEPQNGITLQIGEGCEIAGLTKLPVVYDFRSGDVALGGQGAPLVPVVDKILFSGYSHCINLGGFANISFTSPPAPLPKERGEGRRIAFDICPVNIVLNQLANKLKKEFDKGGKMAMKGIMHKGLLQKLNSLTFYKTEPPKSLGREWVENEFLPVLDSYDISIQDKLRTVTEHAAIQIAAAIKSPVKGKAAPILLTGGGAYNSFLVSRIAAHTKTRISLPDDKTIQFKEAMAFAFLGVLKMRKEINILKSVTGAKRDSSGGKICFPEET